MMTATTMTEFFSNPSWPWLVGWVLQALAWVGLAALIVLDWRKGSK